MIRKYTSLPIDLIIFYIFKDTKLFIFMYRSQGAKAIISNQRVFLELQKEADKVRQIKTYLIHFETNYHYIGSLIFRKNVSNNMGPSYDEHQICLYGGIFRNLSITFVSLNETIDFFIRVSIQFLILCKEVSSYFYLKMRSLKDVSMLISSN